MADPKSVATRKRSFLKPRQHKDDTFKVYKPTSRNAQIDAIREHSGQRTIHVDLEVIYNLARYGLTRDQIAGYYGMTRGKFNALCEEFPEVGEVYVQGFTVGVISTAKRFDNIIQTAPDAVASIAAMFRLKTAGWTEKKDAGKDANDDAPKVTVYLPENNR